MPYLSNAAMAAIAAGQNPAVSLRKGKYRTAPKRRVAARPSPASAMAIRKAGGEKKGMDTDLEIATGSVLSTTSTNANVVACNLIQAGAGSFNRVGRKTFSKSIRVHGHAIFKYEPVATTLNYFESTLRMVVVWDKQPSGTAPTWADIFAWTSQGGTETSAVLALPAYDNMNRFQILRDVKIVGKVDAANDASGTEDAISRNYVIDEYIKLGNRQSVYSGDTSPMTIADISSGAVYVAFRCTVTAAYVEWGIASGTHARLRYSD